MKSYPVCKSGDITVGSAQQFSINTGEDSPLEIALWRDTDGSFHAIDAICTHGDVPLCEGELCDGKVECWAHGAKFDLRTGEASLPATVPVNVYEVAIQDELVTVLI